MASLWHRLGLISGLSVITLSGVACGGRSESEEPIVQGGAPGGGGTAGKGGKSQVGGSTQSGGGVTQSYGGAPPIAGSGGNTEGGTTATCEYNGKIYAVPATFPAGDGCNTCFCGVANSVQCTARACFSCSDFTTKYQATLNEAARCDPSLDSVQCTLSIGDSLTCGCITFANPANKTALEALGSLQAQYESAGCGNGVVCGPCPEPQRSYCSPQGLCAVAPQLGRSCRVLGAQYPNGQTGIKHPESACNTCTCEDGRLICSNLECASSSICPDGQSFGRQCLAGCGHGACQIPEYTCLAHCGDGNACADPAQACNNGVCRNNCFEL